MKTAKTPRITLTLRSADCVTDLLTMAQAVVDAWQEPAHMAKVYRSLEMLSHHLGDAGDIGVETARAILAALDAERAQGYAQAMGEQQRDKDRERYMRGR